MHNFSRTLSVLKHYLTPFVRIALGCVLTLVFSACGQRAVQTLNPAASLTRQPTQRASTLTPTPRINPEQSAESPTPLPGFQPTPNERTPSALGVTSDELRGVKVIVWHPWSGGDGAVFESLLAEFNQHNRWGITAQASGYEGFGRLDEALETSPASGGSPDVVADYGYVARHLDSLDRLVDLVPYVTDPAWGWSGEEQADFTPEFWSEDVFQAQGSAAPRRLGVPYYRSAYVLFYNKSWAQELGYQDAPTSAEDFKAQACAASASLASPGSQSTGGMGGWLVTSQPGAAAGWMRAFGGGITNAKATGYQLNTSQVQRAFEFIKSLQEDGCAWYDPEVNPLEEFASRKALLIVGSLFDIPAQVEAFTQAGNADEWEVTPFPSAEHPVVAAYGPSLMILRSTPVKQLASWLVIDWLVQPPNQAEWVKTLETYPTRKSTLPYLDEAIKDNPQWSQALKLLPQARSEPSLPSWGVMRWALSDALVGLLDLKITSDQIPSLLENLDSVAAEIVTQVP